MAWLGPHRFTLFLCIPLVACGSPANRAGAETTCTAKLPPNDDCDTESPSYAADIAPLVETHCLSCHYAGNPNSSVVLETQSQLSRQVGLVETQLYRCEMPPSDGEALDTNDREELLKWLVCGARNN
jgi:uncharacterized membrane protein